MLQVEAASLTFIPRYVHRMFEFRLGLYLYILICTDWKCELREGVLNIIKLGYKGTCMEVIRCVAIRPDFSWSVYVCGVMVNQKLCTILMDLTETMHSYIA